MSVLVETHFHTAETSPCSHVAAAEGIRMYARLGYHMVVVTDHFQSGWFERRPESGWADRVSVWLRGWKAARKEGDRLGLRVLLGMEFTFPGTRDDMLVYGLSEERILAHPDMHRLGPAGLKRLAGEENLLLVQAHPFRSYVSQIYEDLVDGLEVYNGNPRHHSDNDRAARLAREKGWVALSGSDFHQREDAGRGGIWLPEAPVDTVAFADLLRRQATPLLVTA
jgi:hypothetical protein